MSKLKAYFRKWDSSRVLRLIIGLILTIAYLAEGETLYMGLAIFFLVQAIMNIGCGSSCATGSSQEKTTTYKFNKLDKDNN